METLAKLADKKPISKGTHGLIDYGFALSLAAIPMLTGADRKTTNLYRMLAGQVFLYSALTKQPYAIKPLLSFLMHRKIDVVNLCGLALFSAYKGVAKRKPTLAAHLGLIALGVTTVLLTDWKNKNS